MDEEKRAWKKKQQQLRNRGYDVYEEYENQNQSLLSKYDDSTLDFTREVLLCFLGQAQSLLSVSVHTKCSIMWISGPTACWLFHFRIYVYIWLTVHLLFCPFRGFPSGS